MDLQRPTSTIRGNEEKLSTIRNKRRWLDLFQKLSRCGYPRQCGFQYLFDSVSLACFGKTLELGECCLHALRSEIVTHGHQSAINSLCLCASAFLEPVQTQHNDDRKQS